MAMVVTHLKMTAELIQMVRDGGYAVALPELTIRRGGLTGGGDGYGRR